LFALAMLLIGFGSGFLWGKALLRYYLEKEGWDVLHDDRKPLGEGRYVVMRRLERSGDH